MADVFPADFITMQDQVIAKGHLDSSADLTRVKNWINNAYYMIAIEVEFYQSSSATAALAANATSVNFPATIVKLEYIVPTGSDGTIWGPMRETTFEEILEVRAWQGGSVSTGAPSRFAQRSASSNFIEFWPQAAGGEVLTFYGMALPTALSGNTDKPIFPEPYSKAIEYRALIEAAEQKGDLLMLQQFSSQYQATLEAFRAFNNTPGMVQQFKVEGARPWPKANSVDQGF